MKKLFLVLSLCGVVGLQAAEMIWVQPKPIQVPKGLFPVLDDVQEDLGQTTEKDAIPLQFDSNYLNHAIQIAQGNNNYYLPVKQEELKKEGISLEGLLKTLNFLGVENNYLNNFYIAWLNNPINQNAAVHNPSEGLSSETIFNQMGLDTNKIPEDIKLIKIPKDSNYSKKVSNYKRRQKDLSIQDLINEKTIDHSIYNHQEVHVDHHPIYHEGENLNPHYIEIPSNASPTHHKYMLKGGIVPRIVSLKGLENIPEEKRNNITFINIEGQHISSLPVDTFKGFGKLQEIKINYSKLFTTIEAGAFDGLDRVHNLELNNNAIQGLLKNTFKGLSSLVKLNLSNNKISHIEKEAFFDLKNVEYLDLSNNKISHIEKEAFFDLKNVEYLDLSNNKIKYLNSEMFNGLENVKHINLSQNPLIVIEKNTFSNFTNSNTVSISHTKYDLIKDLILPDNFYINMVYDY